MDKTRKRILLSVPHMGGMEEIYIRDAFTSNWLSTVGPNIKAFEEEFEDRIGLPAVALSSGTAAIHLGLKLLGVRDGDDVFCATLTYWVITISTTSGAPLPAAAAHTQVSTDHAATLFGGQLTRGAFVPLVAVLFLVALKLCNMYWKRRLTQWAESQHLELISFRYAWFYEGLEAFEDRQ